MSVITFYDEPVLDPVLLRSFATVARTLSFTGAARKLGVGQSTVSQHVRRLEDVTGRPLLRRDTHSVELTVDGEVMLEFAGTILDAGERALAHFRETRLHGRLRLGVSEDLVLARLPGILSDFRERYPQVDLELTVGLSENLDQQIDRGELDLLFAKRSPGRDHARTVWRDRYVWLAGPGFRLGPGETVPLVSYPPPSKSRASAISALEARGRAWRMACTSGSLSGLRAAALAGLGVVAHASTLVPDGLVPAPERAGLPELDAFDVTLTPGRHPGPAVDALARGIRASVGDLRS